jgi:5-methyltetrahydropteroyltriglutamate--homocysteine methyltransferase
MNKENRFLTTLMAGTDCGFIIHVGSGGVDPDVVWAKLAVLAQGAQIASRKFWPKR